MGVLWRAGPLNGVTEVAQQPGIKGAGKLGVFDDLGGRLRLNAERLLDPRVGRPNLAYREQQRLPAFDPTPPDAGSALAAIRAVAPIDRDAVG